MQVLNAHALIRRVVTEMLACDILKPYMASVEVLILGSIESE